MRRHRPREAFSLIELLVVIAIIGVLMSLAAAAIQKVRASAQLSSCSNNLMEIGLALQHYHDVYSVFPPGVMNEESDDPYPFMSWNARLLPFIEEGPLWSVTQEAFEEDPFFRDDPPHVGLATVMSLYSCPSDPRSGAPWDVSRTTVAFTDYLGVEGTNQYKKDGILYLSSTTRLAQVTDGTSNTLLVGERPPSGPGRFGWWYGGWGQAQDGSADMVLGVQEQNVLLSDCPAGPQAFSPGSSSDECDSLHFWSYHIGGAQFLLCDGSVHFLSYNAASLMPALATRPAAK